MHFTPTRISINGIIVTGVLCFHRCIVFPQVYCVSTGVLCFRSNTYVRLDCFGEGII
jgi:hypothetical protein